MVGFFRIIRFENHLFTFSIIHEIGVTYVNFITDFHRFKDITGGF